MHSRRSSSPAREFERAQIDPDASEAPVSSMTYGKAALCRLLTLVVAVVVTSAVCIRIGRGAVAVAPVFVSTGLGGCLSVCMQGELGPSAVFL